ncbi:MAG: Transcriptional regulatory protein DegU [Candidatus Marinimicrobia bacterium]|nr:Transcriptional regulatory protein DegU [Candidatus Neomarinimicrobiota bacterium]
MEIRLAIAEDNAQTRNQFVERFEFYDGIDLVHTAENGDDLLEYLSDSPMDEHPDIVLMDIEMPGKSGIETTALLKEKYPYIEVIMSTVFKDEEKIFKSIQAGASGYLLNDRPIDRFVEAMEEVLDGGVPLSRTIARKVLGYIRTQDEANKKTPETQAKKFELSPRELEILQAIVDDETEYAIAYDLDISEHTVRSHVKNIYKKLQVHSRTAVVKMAIKNKLI